MRVRALTTPRPPWIAVEVAAALAVARLLGVSARAAAEAIYTFPGLPHRQETVATINGVRFVNDSKATNAEAAIQALTCYDRIRWIVGGRAKESGLEPALGAARRISRAYLIGEAEARFAGELDGRVPYTKCGTL